MPGEARSQTGEKSEGARREGTATETGGDKLEGARSRREEEERGLRLKWWSEKPGGARSQEGRAPGRGE